MFEDDFKTVVMLGYKFSKYCIEDMKALDDWFENAKPKSSGVNAANSFVVMYLDPSAQYILIGHVLSSRFDNEGFIEPMSLTEIGDIPELANRVRDTVSNFRYNHPWLHGEHLSQQLIAAECLETEFAAVKSDN